MKREPWPRRAETERRSGPTALLVPTLSMTGGLAKSALEHAGGELAITAFPDLDCARQLRPGEREVKLAVMPPMEILDLARDANLVLLIKAPGKDGPVSVVVRPTEIDTHA